jgi:hypothetical protein
MNYVANLISLMMFLLLSVSGYARDQACPSAGVDSTLSSILLARGGIPQGEILAKKGNYDFRVFQQDFTDSGSTQGVYVENMSKDEEDRAIPNVKLDNQILCAYVLTAHPEALENF